jgi:putative heme-binding domain-containing protein
VASSDGPAGVRALAIRNLPNDADFSQWLGDPAAEVRADAMRRVVDPASAKALWSRVADPDAFVAEAARVGLARGGTATADLDAEVLAAKSPAERLAALLILRESRDPKARRLLPLFLADADTAVRFAAVQWVGEERLAEYRGALNGALSAGPATGRLFGGYLAALERLDGVVRKPEEEWAGEQYIVRALDDPRTSAEVRRWSLRMLRPDHPALTMARLREFVAADDPALQLEAVRTLRESPHAERAAALCEIAADASRSSRLRAEAIVGLSGQDDESRVLLLKLAASDDRKISREALRSLRGATLDDAARRELHAIARESSARALVQRVLEPTASEPRPATDDLAGWLKLLAAADRSEPADPEAGERIFFHRRSAGCSGCHQIEGRGARVGPELTAAAGTLTRERLIESIVRPGREIAPQFATWAVVSTSGQTLVGMLVKEEATGEQTYADQQGQLHLFKPGEIETRKPLATSIMPEGLPSLLSIDEFRDLLAYLDRSRTGNE